MYGDINLISVSGILASDPIEKLSKDGSKIFTQFKLKVTNSFKPGGQESSSELPIFVCDESVAKLILLNYKSGDPVFMTGTISYQDKKNGGGKYFTVLHTSAHTFKPLKIISTDVSKYKSINNDMPDDNLFDL